MLVSIASVKGSPGVTTFAVALAARWPFPARPVVIEADPSGGDLGSRLALPPSPGLVSFAAAARLGIDADLVWTHAQRLSGGLSIIAAPPGAEHARVALTELAQHAPNGLANLRAAEHAGAALIIDCGRLDPGSPALPIVRASDVLVLLSRAYADDLAHLPGRLTARPGWPCPMLLLVGPGYPSAEVGRELGVEPPQRIPLDPRGAALLCGRSIKGRWGRSASADSPLGRTAHTIALTLAARAPQSPAGPTTPPPLQASAQVLQPVRGVPPRAVSPRGLRAVPDPEQSQPGRHGP